MAASSEPRLAVLLVAFSNSGHFVLTSALSQPGLVEEERVLLVSSQRGVETLADSAFAQAQRRGEALRILGCGRIHVDTDGTNKRIVFDCQPSRDGLFKAASPAAVRKILEAEYPEHTIVESPNDSILKAIVIIE